MTAPVLHISFAERALAHGDGHLTLQLPAAARKADVSLVIDVYDLDREIHPDGHLGWWKYAIADLDDTVTVRLVADGHTQVAAVDGAMPEESWHNDAVEAERFVVNAVLRSNTTNAILALDRVPALPDEDGIAGFRAALDRNWATPRYAPASFLPAAGEVVHLISPSVFPRDAVGNLCLDLYRVLKQNRIPVRLHAAMCDLALNDIVELEAVAPAAIGPNDRLLYFYSTHDPFLPDLVGTSCAHKAVYFHGVTDPMLLRVFDPELSVACGKAIEALPQLSGFDRLAANSRASAAVLARELNLPSSDAVHVVAPKLVPLETDARAAGARRNALLSVAQLRPHKKIDDVLRLFAAYREIEPAAECWIVGRSLNPAYRDYLHWVETRELELPDGAVRWHGNVPDDDLATLYATAGTYVSMSEDEGFCLPLLEAMAGGLPVLAYDLPAVAETLGPAGLRFAKKEFAHLAEAIAALHADPERLAAIVAAQRARAASLEAGMTGTALLALLAT